MPDPSPDHPLLADLNPAQREAVTSIDGPLLVVAGPGSGKTRVITHRIAWIVAHHVAPWEICALTFTNKAAGEMRDRVERLLPGHKGFWISTFHSLCARILRREVEHAGYQPGFTIYDERDKIKAVEQALAELGLDKKQWPAKAFAWQIGELKNRLADPVTAAEEAETPDEERTAQVYATYERLMTRLNALDFDDLLVKTVGLFYRHPAVLARYQERLRYLMVDEYQDTNLAQYELVSTLAGAHRNLCVTGDPDQSIYAWRGADALNLDHFRSDFAPFRTVLLATNYRSTQAILAAAGALIGHNSGRLLGRLDTPNPPGEPVRILAHDSDRDEARAVVARVAGIARREGLPLASFAIFYRVNAMSRLFEEELMRAGLPFVVVGATGFYDRREVKDLLAYLAILANPRDDLAVQRVINLPPRGIGKSTLDALAEAARAEGVPLAALVARGPVAAASGAPTPETIGLRGRAKGAVTRFGRLLMDLFELERAASGVAHLLEEVLERSGYREMLELSTDPAEVERLDNVRELLRSAEEYDRTAEAPTAAGFLEEVALYRQAEEGGHSDRVQLMSLHAAKGLEFPVVFIAGCEDGLIPHGRSWADPAQLEEERRLLYVGMTRARRALVLSHARYRYRYDQAQYAHPSAFLDEIAPALGAVTADPDHGAGAPVAPPEPDAGAWRVGQVVRHAYFGVGTVLEIDGRGRLARARIHFADGVRTLVLEHAPLVASKSGARG